MLRGMVVPSVASPTVLLRPAVVVNPGSSVPSALRVQVAALPCNATGTGAVAGPACSRQGRFAVAYRDGSASALVRDAVATADGQMQVSLGIP